MKIMIKNWLSYCQNFLKEAYNSKKAIFLTGLIVGLYLDISLFILNMTIFHWCLVFFAGFIISYFFYAKYKINQDTFDSF